MFQIDKASKKAEEIKPASFKELGLKERYDLQEWIAANPSLLREDLLIIQKEFNQFDGSNERLDLLALDKNGSLVIIENKLDDSGTEVVWQALKYASYFAACEEKEIIELFSNYEKIDIITAEEKIREFLEQDDGESLQLYPQNQRIILVAGNFRKEVTSVTLWLINKGIQIKCLTITPFIIGNHFVVNAEQIIPLQIKEAEEYMVKLKDSKLSKEKNARRFANHGEFYATISDPIINELYSRLFNFAKTNNLGIEWGSKGFGLKMTIAGDAALSLLEGFGGNASKDALSIKTKFGYRCWQKIDDGVIEYYRSELENLGFFNITSTKSNYVWQLTEKSTDDEMSRLLSVVKGVIEKIQTTSS